MGLADQCPLSLAKNVKPFLIKADEFAPKHPLVSYFLITYAAHVGLKARNSADKPATAFLMTLLEDLERRKAASAEIADADGRTVLTKMALMLFVKADDAERAGQVSEMIVKLFYTASLLFEATQQFVDEMDPIAKEKHRYARVILVRMKKALETGTPYVSPNRDAKDAVAGAGCTAVQRDGVPQQPPSPAPAPAVPSFTANGNGDSYASEGSGSCSTERSVLGSKQADQRPSNSPPPAVAPPPPPPAWMTAYLPPQPTSSEATSPQPAPRVTQPSSGRSPATAAAAPTTVEHTAPSGEPTMDQMINAQKFAKQAVAALQFYDHSNARLQLLNALSELDGR